MESQLKLVPEEQLPVTDEAKPRKETPNCLAFMLREIMDELKLKDADVVRGTGIAFTTLWDWVSEGVDCQLTDGNLFKLWQFLNKYKKIDLQYLVYGVGEMEDYDDKDEPA